MESPLEIDPQKAKYPVDPGSPVPPTGAAPGAGLREAGRTFPLPVTDRPFAGFTDDTAVKRLAADLQKLGIGTVHCDRHYRNLYSTDASLYQVLPFGVVMPRDADEIKTIVDYCASRRISLLPRGGGTSLAGQCANGALVMDTTPYLRRILAVDAGARTCTVEPGIGIDELNRQLEIAAPGLFFAPDPATISQASIGGCIGNNAAGARSIMYGRTSENLAGVQVILSGGQQLWLEAGAGRRSAVAADLAIRTARVTRHCAADIRHRYPKLVRRNAGYALDSVLAQLDAGVPDAEIDLSGLICGSEGTIAVITAARLKLCRVPVARGLAVAAFADVDAAIAAVEPVLATRPSAVELLDDAVMRAAVGNSRCKPYLDMLPRVEGDLPMAVLYVEYEATELADELSPRFHALKKLVGSDHIRTWTGAGEMSEAWALRRSGEALLHGLPGLRKPVTFVEDNAIPVPRLGEFVGKFRDIVRRHGTQAAFYAHASVGVLHVRPMLNLHDAADRQTMRSIAAETAELARICGGVMSGEHGDGRVRGPLLQDFYGRNIISAFEEIKRIFDPAGILNPGMIVATQPLESITENLRTVAQPVLDQIGDLPTYFNYAKQGGLAHALELCNGAGFCRRRSGGVMCPSYRATLDERHSTRGRANALRMAVTEGQARNGRPNWHDAATLATLDLCLGCKACRTECPSNVDIAQLKAEYLAQHYRDASMPPEAAILANYRQLARVASHFAGGVNRIMSWPPAVRLLAHWGNLAPQRPMPRFSTSLFRQAAEEARRRPSPEADQGPRVVYFGDCFTAFHASDLGMAVVRVVEKLGYSLELADAGCCGRVMISGGLLAQAAAQIRRTLARLAAFACDPRVVAIVVSEPSCFSAMVDDWPKLRNTGSPQLRNAILQKLICIEDFAEKHWDRHPCRPVLAVRPVAAVFHGHCHQKALWGTRGVGDLLRRLCGENLQMPPTGCCGMAGAFGYKQDHYAVSMKLFAESEFDPLRQASADTILLAGGYSCREQIYHATGRRAIHPIQLLDQMLTVPD